MDERQAALAHAIARLRRGDMGGLESLMEAYQVKAVRTAYLITRDRAAAEDIVQSAFVRVYERIHQFNPDRPFEPYFLRIVINDAVKAASRSQRVVSIDAEVGESDVTLAELLPDPTPDPADEAERLEIQRAVWEAMEKLTPKQRAVAVLRYALGYSEAEIAQSLTLPAGTIKWRLHAARQRLHGLLSPLWNESVEGKG
ncbi:MAG: sigma-70 family RNA polymerase sigma factor [Chloroflexota bacterium]